MTCRRWPQRIRGWPWGIWGILLIHGFLFLPRAHAQVLLERSFRVDVESEVWAELRARVPEANWGEKGREAATLTILVNGRYHQDVILFAGEASFRYSFHLGRIRPGPHTIRVLWNRSRSAPHVAAPLIEELALHPVSRTDPEFLPLAHAPILYARPNSIGRFTDIPLLMWYETMREHETLTIRYSVIFSNEDGGTETNALMARWGRATDIEWVYEVTVTSEGHILDARYQGTRHRTLRFRGRREDAHPLLLIASDNNNFSDRGHSSMRFALRPIPFDTSAAAREELMDQHPWTYRIMTEELRREGKLGSTLHVGRRILDPRRYLYVEIASEQRDAGVSLAVKRAGDPSWYTSDLGLAYFKLERSGFLRTTIPLPEGTTVSQIERILLRCDALLDPRVQRADERWAQAGCFVRGLRKMFFLGPDFRPGPSLPVRMDPIHLRVGDMVEIWP
ncbi:MAG: hypothetical protein N0A16_01315 [Blastocatellia bacterium]|nr:hypothetical protein [Blastocatellia bacterium]MCS7156353.1 hypothetical protein [Blastocatellia bacterium]MCX7751296.1 hypothetical protein [Blastocatellia bacterium]MDW8169008.1 hypothetical protein [Acidobacteriota bacterium]MDW8256369.1 hypothetical protein [Acidobacteriota bacterium]